MKERFIFDLDGTILNGSYDREDEYFRNILDNEKALEFEKNRYQLLEEYENKFPKYDIYCLSKFLTNKLNVSIAPNRINEWINLDIEDELVEGAIDLLDYLKSKDKSIVILSNWFRKSQMKRLEKMLLLPYFDQVYAADTYMKPMKDAFIQAAGIYTIEECVMIGDNYEKDYLGAKQIGMDAIYYDRKNTGLAKKEAVKKLEKIKEMY